MREILDTLDRWTGDGLRVATATLVQTERSAPREVGSVMAVSERGDVAGSLTGGCVEPAIYEEAREVLAGGPARLRTYGIEDEEAFEAGLPCGGTVHVLVNTIERELVRELSVAVRTEASVALAMQVSGPATGQQEIVPLDGRSDPALEGDAFVLPLLARPHMYVFGALDHAAAVARIGGFLGYHVTVCDARPRFATRERFPDADELVVGWPDEFLRSAPVDERTAVCILTHDHKFDVPVLKVALETSAGYIGALGARRTNEERMGRLRAAGVGEEALARIHAPIGLDLGARTPEEVAVAVAAEIVELRRRQNQ